MTDVAEAIEIEEQRRNRTPAAVARSGKSRTGDETIGFAKGITPFGNLPYTEAATRHLLFD